MTFPRNEPLVFLSDTVVKSFGRKQRHKLRQLLVVNIQMHSLSRFVFKALAEETWYDKDVRTSDCFGVDCKWHCIVRKNYVLARTKDF